MQDDAFFWSLLSHPGPTFEALLAEVVSTTTLKIDNLKFRDVDWSFLKTKMVVHHIHDSSLSQGET